MIGVRYIGKYNVDYCGDIYHGKIPYAMVIIEEFNKNDQPTGNRKTFYFRKDGKYIVPDMKTEKEVSSWFVYRNYSRIKITEVNQQWDFNQLWNYKIEK